MIKLKKIIYSIAVVMLIGLTSISPALAKESPVPPKPKLYVRDEAGLLSKGKMLTIAGSFFVRRLQCTSVMRNVG